MLIDDEIMADTFCHLVTHSNASSYKNATTAADRAMQKCTGVRNSEQSASSKFLWNRQRTLKRKPESAICILIETETLKGQQSRINCADARIREITSELW